LKEAEQSLHDQILEDAEKIQKRDDEIYCLKSKIRKYEFTCSKCGKELQHDNIIEYDDLTSIYIIPHICKKEDDEWS
jgi:hypothetical protein